MSVCYINIFTRVFGIHRLMLSQLFNIPFYLHSYVTCFEALLSAGQLCHLIIIIVAGVGVIAVAVRAGKT